MNTLRKILIAGLAVASIGAAMAASTTEASAKGWGFHHWGWGFGAAAATGLAIAASSPGYAYGGDCYITRHPVFDGYGNFVGYRHVEVCE